MPTHSGTRQLRRADTSSAQALREALTDRSAPAIEPRDTHAVPVRPVTIVYRATRRPPHPEVTWTQYVHTPRSHA